MTDNTTNNKYFLATTALTDFWVRDLPMIPLGKFCFAGHDSESLKGYQFVDAVDLEMTADTFKDHVAEYYRIYEEILSRICDWLNQAHGVNHSSRYWRIIVGPFLMWYVEWMYDKYRRITAVYERYPDCHALGLAPDNYYTPKDTREFINLSYESGAWNLQLATQVISFLNAGNMTITAFEWERERQGLSNNYGDKKRITIRKGYRDSALKILSRLNTNARTVMYLPTMDVVDRVKLIFRSRFNVWPYSHLKVDHLAECPLDMETRGTLRQVKARDTFEALIFDTLVINLPKTFIEWYGQLSSIQEQRIHHKPKIIVSDNCWYGDELFKIWAASKAQEGTRLVGMQHGGNYGSLFFHYHEVHEKKISDLFLSWGWSDSDKVIPAVSQRVRPIKRRVYKDSLLLLVVNNHPRYHGIGLSTNQDYLEYQFRLAAALEKGILDDLLVRLYPTDYGCNVEKQWREKYPGVKMERAGIAPDFLSRLETCRLIIVDSCNTTMFQTLALNIPTLLFWDTKRWILRESSLPYYDRLKDVGIFHETPESAAEHLAKIVDAVDKWWLSEAVQDARRAFCVNFSRSAKKPHVEISRILKSA